MGKCIYCGKETKGNYKTCYECGYVNNKTVTCEQCGKTLTKDETKYGGYCVECWQKIKHNLQDKK